MADNLSMPGGSTDDAFILNSDSDVTIDLGGYAAQSTYAIGNIDTITLDPNNVYTGSVISTNVTQPYNSYSLTNTWNSDPRVNISNDGVSMRDDCDLKIGDRSLKDFMNGVEDQLAILRPTPELEEKWDQLKDLRRQYEALKQDILEKEKIMKILKEQ